LVGLFPSARLHAEPPDGLTPPPAPLSAEPPHDLTPQAADAIRLLASEDPYERQLGFLRLEALRDPATLPAIAAYLDSTDPETQAYSLRAVAAIRGREMVPTLLNALAHDRQPRMRRAALLGLEPFVAGEPAMVPALLTALRDRDPTVRMTAIDVVSRLDAARAQEAILLRNRRERNRNVRRVLRLALERMGFQEKRP
jgi:HEAT repeat protein